MRRDITRTSRVSIIEPHSADVYVPLICDEINRFSIAKFVQQGETCDSSANGYNSHWPSRLNGLLDDGVRIVFRYGILAAAIISAIQAKATVKAAKDIVVQHS